MTRISNTTEELYKAIMKTRSVLSLASRFVECIKTEQPDRRDLMLATIVAELTQYSILTPYNSSISISVKGYPLMKIDLLEKRIEIYEANVPMIIAEMLTEQLGKIRDLLNKLEKTKTEEIEAVSEEI